MKVALAQINPTVGALSENSRKIEEIIQEYSPKCDLIVFPEMCLTGYPPQDLLMDTAFITKTATFLKDIMAKVQTTPVVLGTIRQEDNKLFNTAAILQDGKVLGYRDKTHLPTYDVFDEDRYFSSANSRNPVELTIQGKSVKLGIEICEDLWDEDYETKVSRELIHAGAEIIVNISASPYHLNRLVERLDIITDKSKNLKCYFIYCNLIGAQDELVFDGQSCVVNPSGELIALSPAFREDIKIVDIENCELLNHPEFREEKQIFYALSLGVQDYFIKTGHEKAVIGLSGGIDSALTAVIASDALGSENVLGVSMPSNYSSDHSINDAKVLAENLGISFQIIPIKKINMQMLKDLSPVLNDSQEGIAEENLQARIRGNILMTTANKKGALLLNTGNKTETALGYCTMYGDMAGALAVISDLNKSQVYAVSRWINEDSAKEVIPDSSITKAPSAELKPNQVDPFDYNIISPLVDILITDPERAYELKGEGYSQALIKKLLKKIRLAEYKRRQAPPGIRISSKAFGVGRKYPIVNNFEA